ncbi:MAG: PGPGW domain-containing protein [Verrucomicrobiota bacterium]
MSEHEAKKWMAKIRRFLLLDKIPPFPRKIIVSLLGGILLIAGIIMIVMPGPAFVFIPLGLLLLASEFNWAEEWAQKMMNLISRIRKKWRNRKRARR